MKLSRKNMWKLTSDFFNLSIKSMISYRCVGEQAQIACQTYCSVFSYSILSVEVRKLLEQCRILGKVQLKGSFLNWKTCDESFRSNAGASAKALTQKFTRTDALQGLRPVCVHLLKIQYTHYVFTIWAI